VTTMVCQQVPQTVSRQVWVGGGCSTGCGAAAGGCGTGCGGCN